jgi:hypothetical protein
MRWVGVLAALPVHQAEFTPASGLQGIRLSAEQRFNRKRQK